MNLKDKVRARAQRDKADAKKAAEKQRKKDDGAYSAEKAHAKETIISALEDVGLPELTGDLVFVAERGFTPYGGGQVRSEGFVFKTDHPHISSTIYFRGHVGVAHIGWTELAGDFQIGPGIHEWIVKKIGE